MPKGSGGGGRPGRSGGGGGDAGQPGEVVRAANAMKDNEIRSGVKTLDSEIRKTQDAIYSDATRKLPIEQRMSMRSLVETLEGRKTELLKEAAKRKSLEGSVKYERGVAVGFK